MCGIAGATWQSGGESVPPDVLDRMTDVLRHRGPDGRGTYWRQFEDGCGVALGHRRLSIIDLEGGRQPLTNENETIWVTFNGEIYNYRELRKQLESKGHVFRTSSDTEVLVHLYEDAGISCLDQLRGMFAFAIWDEPRRRLLLARDRLGQKPLVYRQESGRLLFASEIKALLQVPGVAREVDHATIDEYLAYHYVAHPRTMYVGIRKLPPGHFAVYQRDRLEVRRYWNPDFESRSGLGIEHLRQRLREELDEAVRLRLRSDVPLGAFLSGGIDSTTIVGLMQSHSAEPTKTYTIGFPEGGFNETEFARTAARHLGTQHHELEVQPDSVRLLPILTRHFDEPFGDASAIPSYYLAEMTRQHVKVALTGDGGDELFAGYRRYRTAHSMGSFDRLPHVVRAVVANVLGRHLPVGSREFSFTRRLRSRLESLPSARDRRAAQWVTIFDRRLRHALYTDEFRFSLKSSDPVEVIAGAARVSNRRSPGKQATIADLLTYLPCDLLTKVDVTSMAHGLECRSPLLDHHVVELALSIPFKYLVAGEETKPMIAKTFQELIPDSLRNRPKTGFCVPVRDWFRHDLNKFAREILLDESSLARGYFRRRAVEEFLDQHQQGSWDHGDRIWALLCLESWHRIYIDSSPTSSSDAVSVGCVTP